MIKLSNNPQLIFFISVPIVILLGILTPNHDLDINIHDTYYVISYFHVSIMLSLLFSLAGIGYSLMVEANKPLNKWLNFSHVLLTFGSLLIPIIYWLISLIFNSELSLLIEYMADLNTVLVFAIASIILGQIIFLLNIVIGLLRKKRNI